MLFVVQPKTPRLLLVSKREKVDPLARASSSSSSPAGLMIPWRRRWCVLKDETFMWFRSKQESLKSGWLYKKGGGLSTLSRRLL